eukprot:6063801-Alexandrium_andersonii.AAC.1
MLSSHAAVRDLLRHSVPTLAAHPPSRRPTSRGWACAPTFISIHYDVKSRPRPKMQQWHGGSAFTKRGIAFSPVLTSEDIGTPMIQALVPEVLREARRLHHQALVLGVRRFVWQKPFRPSGGLGPQPPAAGCCASDGGSR